MGRTPRSWRRYILRIHRQFDAPGCLEKERRTSICNDDAEPHNLVGGSALLRRHDRAFDRSEDEVDHEDSKKERDEFIFPF